MASNQFSPQLEIRKKSEDIWHALGTEEVLKQLDTFEEEGLSDEEAARRLEKFGPNQLAEKPPISFWKMLWDQFNNFVVIMLIVASAISALLGDYIEAAAIMAIVILNAALGVFQEKACRTSAGSPQKAGRPGSASDPGRLSQNCPILSSRSWRPGAARSRELHTCRFAINRSCQLAN